MKAYKCDRCGEFYDKEATSIQGGNYYVLKILTVQAQSLIYVPSVSGK